MEELETAEVKCRNNNQQKMESTTNTKNTSNYNYKLKLDFNCIASIIPVFTRALHQFTINMFIYLDQIDRVKTGM